MPYFHSPLAHKKIFGMVTKYFSILYSDPCNKYFIRLKLAGIHTEGGGGGGGIPPNTKCSLKDVLPPHRFPLPNIFLDESCTNPCAGIIDYNEIGQIIFCIPLYSRTSLIKSVMRPGGAHNSGNSCISERKRQSTHSFNLHCLGLTTR